MLDYICLFLKDIASVFKAVVKVIGKSLLWAGIIITLVLMYKAGWTA